MASFPHGVSHRLLPRSVLPALGQFLEHYGQQQSATWLTHHQLPQTVVGKMGFWLLASQQFSGLVVYVPEADDPTPGEIPGMYRVSLTFELGEIAGFLQGLMDHPDLSPDQQDVLGRLQDTLVAATFQIHAEFTLALVDILSQALLETQQAAVCQPVQQALDQQLEQSLLLNQVVAKIQASLELPEILQTTVAEVCHFLQVDRLLIYQFDIARSEITCSMAPFQEKLQEELQEELTEEGEIIGQAHQGGYITYESRAQETLPSVLHYRETYCFEAQPDCHLRHLEGKALAVDDVQTTYAHVPCLLAFLQQVKVRSKVIAPIVVNYQLWGLLIGHQCTYQRQWQSWELKFLQKIAEHLAIAISQAQLYQQLQQQTHNLEDCVIERTQNLRDALAAAQSANRAKSEFLATMSHELRTPLTCIIGMSATLLRWSFGDLSPRQRDYLTTIHTSGEHLLALINDILEVSKIEAGRTVLDLNQFSITSLSRQSLDAYRTEAAQRHIELHLDLKLLNADQDAFIADPRRVRQILANLLSNAIKFTPDGGKVTLRVRRDPHLLTFQVEDTGIGIPENQQPLLFEKFQQLENVRQRQYQGTGLGLALTKQLVDLHGGSVNVASKVGVGSIFTVRLPIQKPLGQRGAAAAAQSISTEPIVGRIVLVEDNEESAGVICDMLTAANYQVIWVIEGSQVLEQVELLQPAAVLISVTLSDVNGYDIIQSLRRYVGTLDLKILALAEAADPQQVQKADRSGADQVLTKPINPEYLLKVVNALMSVPLAESSSPL